MASNTNPNLAQLSALVPKHLKEWLVTMSQQEGVPQTQILTVALEISHEEVTRYFKSKRAAAADLAELHPAEMRNEAVA